MYLCIHTYIYIYMHIHTFIYIYIHMHTNTGKYKYIHICIYKYLVWYNSLRLLTKFLINIYKLICNINVHSFFCQDVILLQPWTSHTNDGCSKETKIYLLFNPRISITVALFCFHAHPTVDCKYKGSERAIFTI